MWFVWKAHREKRNFGGTIINLSKISYRDLDRRRAAKELQEELENATLNCLAMALILFSDFVGTTEDVEIDVIEKLEKGFNQNELLRNALVA